MGGTASSPAAGDPPRRSAPPAAGWRAVKKRVGRRELALVLVRLELGVLVVVGGRVLLVVEVVLVFGVVRSFVVVVGVVAASWAGGVGRCRSY